MHLSVRDEVPARNELHPELVVKTDCELLEDRTIGGLCQRDPRRPDLLYTPSHRGIVWIYELADADGSQLILEVLENTSRVVLIEGGAKLGQPVTSICPRQQASVAGLIGAQLDLPVSDQIALHFRSVRGVDEVASVSRVEGVLEVARWRPRMEPRAAGWRPRPRCRRVAQGRGRPPVRSGPNSPKPLLSSEDPVPQRAW